MGSGLVMRRIGFHGHSRPFRPGTDIRPLRRPPVAPAGRATDGHGPAQERFFLRPMELERLATLRLVSTLSTVPVFRYFERTWSRIASRWS